MRFLIDANLPKALSAWINTKGHSCEHVLDLNLAQAKDNVLWLRAEATDAVIVSKDEDFADLVRRSAVGPSVVWLRTGNGTRRDLLLVLNRYGMRSELDWQMENALSKFGEAEASLSE